MKRVVRTDNRNFLPSIKVPFRNTASYSNVSTDDNDNDNGGDNFYHIKQTTKDRLPIILRRRLKTVVKLEKRAINVSSNFPNNEGMERRCYLSFISCIFYHIDTNIETHRFSFVIFAF